MTNASPEASRPFAELIQARLDEVIEFRHSLTSESDRGCALLAASYLDGEIETLLKRHFVDEPNVVAEMLSPNGPIGSFSTRIDLAFLLGLIGSTARRDLQLIRKIRNDFGHCPHPLTFDEPSIAARCREMRLTIVEKDARPRQHFTNAVLGVTASIHVAHASCQHLAPGHDTVLDEATKAKVRALVTRLLAELLGEHGDGEQGVRTLVTRLLAELPGEHGEVRQGQAG